MPRRIPRSSGADPATLSTSRTEVFADRSGHDRELNLVDDLSVSDGSERVRFVFAAMEARWTLRRSQIHPTRAEREMSRERERVSV
ncbi:helicase SWR1 [Pseudozyma hubeiensis SY62]|uniref:Helicase SWR1 n=1 Tax=Pseudozyma hubeiensis (strain SY62) TaxID=1305764 RepID=R9PDE1_PSEHS|nr:helicase SWR1 [Pseudozyma hubeiensis SY62]GAC96125.1 helicase SWR1 [Pseudozyma hubeiensis SY62]